MAKAKKKAPRKKAAKKEAAKSNGKDKKQPKAKPKSNGKPKDDFPAVPGVPEAGKKKTAPPPDLEKVKKPVLEAQEELVKAENDARALQLQAKAVLSTAKKRYAEALAPYREACKKAGVPCEFTGGKAGPVAPRVRFLVERVDKGIKVAIKDRPETEETIPDKVLKESLNRAAYDYVERHVGPRSVAGNKAGGLSNRLRKVFRGK